MQELEHPIAIYYDIHGERQEIKAFELGDPKVLEKAKSLSLVDPSEQIALSPRIVAGKAPHFLAPTTTKIRNIYSGEKNLVHDNRIQANLTNLNSCGCWKVFTRDYINKQPVTTDLFNLDNYRWNHEVHRIVGADTIVRHDLFGQAKQIEMSVFRPWVAIEVINTHYPEEVAFKALIALSQMMPLLVAFDFTDRVNYFFKIDPATGTIAVRLYIYNGCVWFSGNKMDISSSAGLEIFAKNEIKRLEKIDAWKKTKNT
jgi:hypothetical protein